MNLAFKCIAETISNFASYKSKFKLTMTDLTNNTSYFSNMHDHIDFVFQVSSLVQEFENRFYDLKKVDIIQ